MVRSDNKEVDRRSVLKSVAATGTAGVGITMAGNVAATGEETGSNPTVQISEANETLNTSDGVREALKEDGVILDHGDDVPDRISNGEALFETLTADGFSDSLSLESLPTATADGGNDGYQRFVAGENKHVVFYLETNRGHLQIAFTEETAPKATLFPEDGAHPVVYRVDRNDGYKRSERADIDIGVENSTVTPYDCGSGCGGCECVPDLCWTLECYNCVDGICTVTTTCTVQCNPLYPF